MLSLPCHSLLKSHYEIADQNYHSHRVALSVCSEVTGLKDYQLGHRGQPTDLHTRDARGSIFLLRGGTGQEIFFSGRGGVGWGEAGIKIRGAGQGSNPPGAGHFRGRAKRP